jgi:hypothetical protein
VQQADVLIVGTSIDPHVDRVIEKLAPHLNIARLDVDRYPVDSSIDVAIGRGGGRAVFRGSGGEALGLDHVPVGWFRRLGKPGLHPQIAEEYQSFAMAEANHTLESVLELAGVHSWVNAYWTCRRASVKPRQYAMARSLNMHVPETMVTNWINSAREWLSAREHAIAKTLSAPVVFSGDQSRGFSFTHVIDEVDRQNLSQVAVTPVQFQELVSPEYEVRVTTAFGKHFAVRIDSDVSESKGIRDWRSERISTEYSWHELPSDVSESLGRLLDSLGLTFAASDFIVTGDGRYFFLEANPHGAWLWLEDELGDDRITAYLANSIASLIRNVAL